MKRDRFDTMAGALADQVVYAVEGGTWQKHTSKGDAIRSAADKISAALRRVARDEYRRGMKYGVNHYEDAELIVSGKAPTRAKK